MSWWRSLSMSDAGAVICFVIVGILAIVPQFMRPKRNRRVGLPQPRPDDRSSIEQFKRIHTP